MSAVRFLHLRTREAWLRCDHRDTALHPELEAIQLATAEAGAGASSARAPTAARNALNLNCDPFVMAVSLLPSPPLRSS